MVTPRLLLLTSEFPPGPGGIGVHSYQLACHLQRHGWQLEVIAPQPYVPAETQATFNAQLPFAISPLAPSSPIKRWQQIWRRISQFRPQVLVASGKRPLWISAILGKGFSVPWLGVGHGTEFLNGPAVQRAITHWAIQQADEVIAVSHYTAKLIQTKRPFPLTIIPNGADHQRFRPNLPTQMVRQQLGLQGKQVLLTVGNVSERKAQDVVIRALPAISARCPDVVYLIVGLPTRQKELEQLAQELGVAHCVKFAGMVPAEMLPIYYNLSDLFVLVSRESRGGDVEGYGIVVVEAALCGKTAVVSNHGGLPEAVHHGQTGLIVPTESPQETAKAIITLLTHESQRQQLAQQALQYAAEATWEKRILAYDAILRQMLL